jgi:hypothetical protein
MEEVNRMARPTIWIIRAGNPAWTLEKMMVGPG